MYRRVMAAICGGLMGLLALLLPGCQARSELHIAYPTWVGFESLTLADELGWLPENTVLKRLESAEDVMRAVLENRVHGAAMSLEQAVLLRREIDDLTVVLVMDESAGADMLLARPEIKTLQNLGGARIAYSQASAVSRQLLNGALASAGLTTGDVELIDLPLSQLETAFRDGRVDAVVGFPPTTDRIRTLGARPLYDSSEMPGTILDVLAVRRSSLVNLEETLVGTIRGHFRALEHLRSNRDDAVYRYADYQQTNAASVVASLAGIRLPAPRGVRDYLRPDGTVHRAALRLIDSGVVTDDVNLREFADSRYLPTDAP